MQLSFAAQSAAADDSRTHDSLRASLRASKAKAVQREDDLKQAVAQLQREFASAREVRTKLMQSHGILSTAHSELELAHSSQLERSAQLREQHKGLQTEHSTLQKTCSQLESDLAVMNSKHDKLAEQHIGLQQSHESLSAAHSELKIAHTAQLHQAAQLALRHKGLQAHLNILQDICYQLLAGQAAMLQKNIALHNQHEQLQQAAVLAQDERVDLQEQLAAKAAVVAAITAAEAAVCRQRSELQAQHTQLLDSLVEFISSKPSAASDSDAVSMDYMQMQAGAQTAGASAAQQQHGGGRTAQQAVVPAEVARPSGSSADEHLMAEGNSGRPSAAKQQLPGCSVTHMIDRLQQKMQVTEERLQQAADQKAASAQHIEHIKANSMEQRKIALAALQMLRECRKHHMGIGLALQQQAGSKESMTHGGAAPSDMDLLVVTAAASHRAGSLRSSPQTRAGTAVEQLAGAGAQGRHGHLQDTGHPSKHHLSAESAGLKGLIAFMDHAHPAEACSRCSDLLDELKIHAQQAILAGSQQSQLQHKLELMEAQQEEMGQDLAVARFIAAQRFDALNALHAPARPGKHALCCNTAMPEAISP